MKQLKITGNDIVFGLARVLTQLQDSHDLSLLRSAVIGTAYTLWQLKHNDIKRSKSALNDLESLL